MASEDVPGTATRRRGPVLPSGRSVDEEVILEVEVKDGYKSLREGREQKCFPCYIMGGQREKEKLPRG